MIVHYYAELQLNMWYKYLKHVGILTQASRLKLKGGSNATRL